MLKQTENEKEKPTTFAGFHIFIFSYAINRENALHWLFV